MQYAIKHPLIESNCIKSKKQKNQPLGPRGWFFVFLSCIFYTYLVNIIPLPVIKKALGICLNSMVLEYSIVVIILHLISIYLSS